MAKDKENINNPKDDIENDLNFDIGGENAAASMDSMFQDIPNNIEETETSATLETAIEETVADIKENIEDSTEKTEITEETKFEEAIKAEEVAEETAISDIPETSNEEAPKKSILDELEDIGEKSSSDENSKDKLLAEEREIETPVEFGEKEEKTSNKDGLITVRPVKFQEFKDTPPNRAIKKNLDILQDITMHISVELGKTKSSIKEVMEMEKGSVVELDKIAGEQVEIYVNEKLVAKGEVIVIEDKFGVRVTSTNLAKAPATI